MVGATRIELVTPSMSRKCSPAELSALVITAGQTNFRRWRQRFIVIFSPLQPQKRGPASRSWKSPSPLGGG